MGVKVREKDGKWYVFINHQGKRKAKCVGDSKKAALEVKRKIEAKLTLGDLDLLDDKPQVPTFQECAEGWLETHARHNCKEATYGEYAGILRQHLLPVLAGMRLHEITREHVKQLAFCLRDKFSVARTTGIISVLRAILNQAVDDGLIAKNPAVRIMRYMPKRQERAEVESFTRDELFHLLNIVSRERPRYYPFFLLLARTGMRLGEAIGLQWDDIDWQRKIIIVQRGVRNGIIGTPKSGNTRRVDMSNQLTNVLSEWQTHCEIEAIERGFVLPEWVFATRGGQPFHASHLRNWVWRHCLARAGFHHIKIHALRHTYASLLIQQGESLAYIRDQLGHHSIQLTVDTYGHLVPGGNRQAVDRLDDTPSGASICNLSATTSKRV